MTAKVYRRPDGRVLAEPRKDMRVETFANAEGICNRPECRYDIGALLDLIRLAKQLLPGPVVETIRDELRLCGWNPDAPLWVADHIIPLSEGGPDTPANMQLLCQRCHAYKTREEAGRRARRKPRPSAKEKRGLCDGSGRRPHVVQRMPERVLGCPKCNGRPGITKWGNVKNHGREAA